MTASDNLEERFAKLRGEWPAASLVDDVMKRIPSQDFEMQKKPAFEPTMPTRRRGRLFAGLVSSGLFIGMAIAWVMIISRPTTLLAAIQDNIKNAQSAHVVITHWNDKDVAVRTQIWYRKNVGVRVESPDEVCLEDGKTQWTWSTKKTDGERVILRQKSPGFFTTQLAQMVSLPENSPEWTKVRSAELDREIHGRKCQASILTFANDNAAPSGNPSRPQVRGIVLAETGGRIHEITVEEQRKEGSWRPVAQTQIDYDAAVPGEKVLAKLPEGVRVVDRAEAFYAVHPLEKALKRVEIEGLIFAVHDIQPLENGDGFYVVSSVRGSEEYLKTYPPQTRAFNQELMLLDVAFQPGSNMSQGGNYFRVVLGNAQRDGVEYSWWLVMPRRFYEIKDGKRIERNDLFTGQGEPERLDNQPGKAMVPLMAVLMNPKHRDANGVSPQVMKWVEVPVPADRSPAILLEVAGRAKRDSKAMSVASAGGLIGIAADEKGAPNRAMTRIMHDVSDADFAAAIQRGIDDMSRLNQLGGSDPGPFPPGGQEK